MTKASMQENVLFFDPESLAIHGQTLQASPGWTLLSGSNGMDDILITNWSE